MCRVAEWIIMGFLAVLSVFDIKRKEIPILLLIFMGVAVLFFRIFLIKKSLTDFWGGIVVGGLFLMGSKVTKEAIGYGDSLSILALGGFTGGMAVVEIVMWASVGASLISLFVCMKNGWRRKNTLPFLPFLAAGYLGVMIL